MSRFRVMYARTFELYPVDHYGGLFVIHAQRKALVRELFSVHKQRKVADITMLKLVSLGFLQAYKFGVLKHNEQEAFVDGAEDGFIDTQEF